MKALSAVRNCRQQTSRTRLEGGLNHKGQDMDRCLTGQRSETEIEVTPAMIEAGAAVVWRGSSYWMPYGSTAGLDLAEQVYRAMASIGSKRAR
jgi:hypothetical protein